MLAAPMCVKVSVAKHDQTELFSFKFRTYIKLHVSTLSTITRICVPQRYIILHKNAKVPSFDIVFLGN